MQPLSFYTNAPKPTPPNEAFLLDVIRKLYALKGGMAEPCEHAQTREALRAAEMALYGYTTTP